MKSDIAQILKDIKLPERRDTEIKKPESAKEPKKFDTSLAGQALGAMLDAPLPQATSQPAPSPAAAPSPIPPPIAQTPITPAAPAVGGKSSVVALHTLKDDLQHVVRDQKISVVRAVSLEAERRHREQGAAGGTPDNFSTPAQAQRSKRTFGILFSVLFLMLLGGAALGGVYLIAQQRAGSTAPPPMQSILFAESTVALPLGNQSASDLKRILGSARESAGGTLGSITRIVPTVASVAPDGSATTRAATLEEFLKALGAGAPADLLRAAGKEFFFGIHTVDKNAPIIVITVSSYDRAFAAMLAWEPLMNTGLAPAFTPLPAQTLDANGLPTLRTFQDVIMRNYDARALKDDAGEVQLYYSFPTQNVLIIAESPYSFAEILSRLQAERKL